jgi:23S rRNA (guanosine2251-2'-O)-methyltransferase
LKEIEWQVSAFAPGKRPCYDGAAGGGEDEDHKKDRLMGGYPDSSETRRDESGAEQAGMLSGAKPVAEMIRRCPSRIDCVFVRKGRRDADCLLDLCRAGGVRFSLVGAEALDRMCAAGHQGVAARLAPIPYTPLEELLRAAPVAPLPLLVALDQVQDAGNAGTLARTLYALGGAGLIVPRHNGVFLGAGARRAAAGALERLPVARVTNMARTLETASAAGFAVYGTTGNADAAQGHSAFAEALRLPAVLALGGEERGLRPLVRRHCGRLIFVPMLRDMDSLNVAQAGGILIALFLRWHMESSARPDSDRAGPCSEPPQR